MIYRVRTTVEVFIDIGEVSSEKKAIELAKKIGIEYWAEEDRSEYIAQEINSTDTDYLVLPGSPLIVGGEKNE